MCFITVHLESPQTKKTKQRTDDTAIHGFKKLSWFSHGVSTGKAAVFSVGVFSFQDQRYWAARLFELGCGSQVGKPRMKVFQPNHPFLLLWWNFGGCRFFWIFVDIDTVEDLYYIYVYNYMIIVLYLYMHNCITFFSTGLCTLCTLCTSCTISRNAELWIWYGQIHLICEFGGNEHTCSNIPPRSITHPFTTVMEIWRCSASMFG